MPIYRTFGLLKPMFRLQIDFSSSKYAKTAVWVIEQAIGLIDLRSNVVLNKMIDLEMIWLDLTFQLSTKRAF